VNAARATAFAAAFALAAAGAFADGGRTPPARVTADKAARTVRFPVEASGAGLDDIVEFAIVGEHSDKMYETVFFTSADPREIAGAIDGIGVPPGEQPDSRDARFWPRGEKLSLHFVHAGTGRKYRLEDVIADTLPEEKPELPGAPLAVRGARAQDGSLEASTNSPCSVFSLFNCPQSSLALPGALLQSSVYGRFKPKAKFAKGEKFEAVLSWDGASRVRRYDATAFVSGGGEIELELVPRGAAGGACRASMDKALERLRKEAKDGADIYVTPGFAPDFPLSKTRGVAGVFMMLDGLGMKVNGRLRGVSIHAFDPQEAWRERARRPFQPFEIRQAADGSRKFTYVREDWSGEGMEPVLHPEEKPFKEWSELPGLIAGAGKDAEKIDTALFFMSGAAPAGDFISGAAALPERINTVYVFAE